MTMVVSLSKDYFLFYFLREMGRNRGEKGAANEERDTEECHREMEGKIWAKGPGHPW